MNTTRGFSLWRMFINKGIKTHDRIRGNSNVSAIILTVNVLKTLKSQRLIGYIKIKTLYCF